MSPKLAVDAAMLMLLLVAMAYRITGNTLHEIAGIFRFALVIAHNLLNRRWYGTIPKAGGHAPRILNAAVNLLLCATMAALLGSAVSISHTLFDFIPRNSSLDARRIHVLCAYWGFVLMSMHAGMHWSTMVGAVGRITGIKGTNRMRTTALRAVSVLIVVYGVRAFIERDIGSKLILYYSFDFWSFDEPAAWYFIRYASIMGALICGTHYLRKWLGPAYKKGNLPGKPGPSHGPDLSTGNGKEN